MQAPLTYVPINGVEGRIIERSSDCTYVGK